MSKRKDTDPKSARKISRRQAARALIRLQHYVGASFLLSAAFGSYLLATDQSIWRLAVSHAFGLVVIVLVDVVLGTLNLAGVRQVYIPSLVWAALTVLLQLGDVVTAPQYKMTIAYFASYLFGLWAFDALLLMQVLAIGVALIGRSYVSALTRKKKDTFFELTARSSRRDFLQITAFIGSFIALAGVLGAVEALSPNTSHSSPSQSTQALMGYRRARSQT